MGILVIATVWSIDGIWQFVTGTSLLGHPYNANQVTGVFHPQRTLGIALAAVSPLVFEALRRLSSRHRWMWFLVGPFVAAIIIAGSRSAWIALGVGAAGYTWFWIRVADLPTRVGYVGGLDRLGRIAAIGVAGTILLALVTFTLSDSATRGGRVILSRAADFVEIFSGDRERVDEALSQRLSIWETAANMVHAHWLNGVGPRGFRYAYADFATAQDFWTHAEPSRIPTHPHQLLLEVLVETGIIGLVGYLLILIAGVRWVSALEPGRLLISVPFVLVAFVALFPLNVHKGFYGNFAASMIWWSIATAVAAMCVETDSRGQDFKGSNPLKTHG